MNNATDTPPTQEPTVQNNVQVVDKNSSSNNSVLILSVIVALLVGVLVAKTISDRNTTTKSSLMSKQVELDARTASINKQRQELGLEPLVGVGSEGADKIAARLTRDAASLANYADGFRSKLTEKDSLLQARTEELIDSEEARKALASQLAKAQNELDSVVAKSGSVEELRKQLQDSEAALAKLREEVALYSNRPTTEELAVAKARILELESMIAAMQTAPAPAPAKLFAESEADLYPQAQGLFRALSELEDKADLEISASYNRFATQYKASFLKEVKFDTGSSSLKPADKLAIGDALATLPDGSMVLVVGYASTTGNADNNRRLSSDRATVVASNIDQAKPGNQPVQAVFLGQTKRFSSRIPERNQVCEVWAILP